MADENTSQEEKKSGQSDDFKNLKAEFNRKFDSNATDLKKSNEALMHQLQQLSERFSQANPKPLAVGQTEQTMDDLYIDNPAAYAKKVKADATAEATKMVDEKMALQQAAQVKQQTLISKLYADYPELGSTDHALTKRAIEIHGAMPDEDKASSLAYKLAVKEAASELGIKPKSKRTEAEMQETFSLRGSGGSNPPSTPKQKLDPKTERFAAIMGIDLSNKETKAKFEKSVRATNTEWMSYK